MPKSTDSMNTELPEKEIRSIILGFFTQNGNYGTTGGLAPCGALEGKDLLLEDDGSFEIILSKDKKGKNWLKIEDETGTGDGPANFFKPL